MNLLNCIQILGHVAEQHCIDAKFEMKYRDVVSFTKSSTKYDNFELADSQNIAEWTGS